MISKHIKHQLSAEGKTYFQQWLKRLDAAKAETPGFVGILIGKQRGDENTTHLILQFENEQGYQNWANNPTHETLLVDLKPYLTTESTITLFDFEIYG